MHPSHFGICTWWFLVMFQNEWKGGGKIQAAHGRQVGKSGPDKKAETFRLAKKMLIITSSIDRFQTVEVQKSETNWSTVCVWRGLIKLNRFQRLQIYECVQKRPFIRVSYAMIRKYDN